MDLWVILRIRLRQENQKSLSFHRAQSNNLREHYWNITKKDTTLLQCKNFFRSTENKITLTVNMVDDQRVWMLESPFLILMEHEFLRVLLKFAYLNYSDFFDTENKAVSKYIPRQVCPSKELTFCSEFFNGCTNDNWEKQFLPIGPFPNWNSCSCD